MPGRIPPHSDDAEKSALGAALLDQDALSEILEIVKPEDFYNKANHDIFEAMRDMFNNNEAVDIITVTNEMKKRKTLESAGGTAYIADLSTDIPTTTNAADYAKIVAEKAAMRNLIKAADTIRDKCYNDEGHSKDILDSAEEDILSIAQTGQKRDYTRIQDIMLEDIELISARSQDKGKLTGIPTGFKKMDDVTGGLQKSDLIVLAARPGMGKTAFALNVALNAAQKAGSNILMFSMEMSKEQLGQRLLAMKANVDMQDISRGTLANDKWRDLIVASDEIGKLNINIDDTPNPSIYDIKNKARRMLAGQGLDLIVVDYLQLMVTQSENVVQEVSQLTRMFKLMARELNCPIILLSQLSKRPDQRENHRPQPADLRDSGSIEQDADIIIFLYRDDYYHPKDSEKPGICEVNIAKHRNGPTKTFDLTWVSRYTKFADVIDSPDADGK